MQLTRRLGAAATAMLLLAQSPALPESLELKPWKLSKATGGCGIYTSYTRGSVLSVWALRTKPELIFVIQNKRWASLQDGEPYRINVRFDDSEPWTLTATAQTSWDEDGPGLMFDVAPGKNSDGENFIAEFAFAKGMHLTRNSEKIESLLLSGTRRAIVALARCIGKVRNSKNDPFAVPDSRDSPTTEEGSYEI